MSTHTKPTYSIPGIISLYSSFIILSGCALFAFCIQQNIIRYDKADLLSFVLLVLIPVLASWGVAFGIIGLMQKGVRRVVAVMGTTINAFIIAWVFFFWVRFFLFFSNFNGWID